MQKTSIDFKIVIFSLLTYGPKNGIHPFVLYLTKCDQKRKN